MEYSAQQDIYELLQTVNNKLSEILHNHHQHGSPSVENETHFENSYEHMFDTPFGQNNVNGFGNNVNTFGHNEVGNNVNTFRQNNNQLGNNENPFGNNENPFGNNENPFRNKVDSLVTSTESTPQKKHFMPPTKAKAKTKLERNGKRRNIIKLILNILFSPLIVIFIGILNFIVFADSSINDTDFKKCKRKYLEQIPFMQNNILIKI